MSPTTAATSRSDAEPRPPVDTNALNRFLVDIGSYTPELIFGIKPGQALYHYTDLSGLAGIIETHDLWLTHLRYSNDDEELTLGYRQAAEVIEVLRRSRRGPDWPKYLAGVNALLLRPAPQGVYICCFCEKDDLLSQWRSYGANGTGASVKLNHDDFGDVTGPDSPHGGLMRLWKVFYDPRQQRRILRNALSFAFEYGEGTLESRAQQAASAIEFFVPTFKHRGFREERECRLIFTPPPACAVKPRFRVGRGMLIPYYSLRELSGGPSSPLHKLPIVGVRVGPGPNRQLTAQSMRDLLARADYPFVEVVASETPYRG